MDCIPFWNIDTRKPFLKVAVVQLPYKGLPRNEDVSLKVNLQVSVGENFGNGVLVSRNGMHFLI